MIYKINNYSRRRYSIKNTNKQQCKDNDKEIKIATKNKQTNKIQKKKSKQTKMKNIENG